MTHRIVFTIICALTLIGCSHSRPDGRLFYYVAGLISENPEEALAALQSIDRNTLREDDRHYYDFLTLKARDNANLRHTSDTLFLSVLDYYSQRPSWNLYPEVLYYGGRVYTDLGDYSTALKFFNAAEDILSDSDNDRELKGRVLSQMGRLLNSLCLFDEGVACLKESINIDRELNDTIGEVSDLQLLGGIYLRAQQIPEAEKYFRLALNKSQNLDTTHRAKSSMYLGAAKYRLGEIDSALIYIRETPSTVHPMERSRALSYAIKIYYDAGLKDSAFIYACQLIESKDTLYTPTAYSVLLSTELRNRLNPDTAAQYLSDHLSLLESLYDGGQINMTVNQQLLHNYDLHLKHRQKAERFNIILKRTVGGITLLALIMAVIILLLKNRNKRNVIKLHIALENISRLENIIKKPQTSSQPSYSDDDTTPTSNRDEESLHALRQ
ncbi:MAG: tetratricopeptide repeat protein, partial [Paramuribaculum sp.]|nr:tetratricopeptide repeat protein [Paramuribaculum sp.]